MNLTKEEKIKLDVQLHYLESLQHFSADQVVGCFLQGSQNYGLDYEDSDVDTKLIVTPSFKDVCLNKPPVSTTHVRANNEHTDVKDIRSYMACFRKQNLNFLEILFTPYFVLNPMYEEQWMRLVAKREEIARMNEFRAVKSMKGIAMNKYKAMERGYPSKVDIIGKYGYDGKQVSHLLRIDDYLKRYIAGESYESCLRPSPDLVPRIMDYKLLDRIPLEEARKEAEAVLLHTIEMDNAFSANHADEENEEMRALLEDVTYNIMKISVEKELQK